MFANGANVKTFLSLPLGAKKLRSPRFAFDVYAAACDETKAYP